METSSRKHDLRIIVISVIATLFVVTGIFFGISYVSDNAIANQVDANSSAIEQEQTDLGEDKESVSEIDMQEHLNSDALEQNPTETVSDQATQAISENAVQAQSTSNTASASISVQSSICPQYPNGGCPYGGTHNGCAHEASGVCTQYPNGGCPYGGQGYCGHSSSNNGNANSASNSNGSSNGHHSEHGNSHHR